MINNGRVQANKMSDVEFLNLILETINKLILSDKNIINKYYFVDYAERTLFLGFSNAIYHYAGVKEPVLYTLCNSDYQCNFECTERTGPGKYDFNYRDLLKLKYRNQARKVKNYTFPLLDTNPNRTQKEFEALISELNAKIIEYPGADSFIAMTNKSFIGKLIHKLNQTSEKIPEWMKKLLLTLYNLLNLINEKTIEISLSAQPIAALSIFKNNKSELNALNNSILHNLPNEIILNVARFLELDSLFSFKCCSQFFYNTLDDWQLWQHYLQRDFPEQSQYISKYNEHPKDLYVSLKMSDYTIHGYVGITITTDSIQVINNDPMRLLNRLLINRDESCTFVTYLHSNMVNSPKKALEPLLRESLSTPQYKIPNSSVYILCFSNVGHFWDKLMKMENPKDLKQVWTFSKKIPQLVQLAHQLTDNLSELVENKISVQYTGTLFKKVNTGFNDNLKPSENNNSISP